MQHEREVPSARWAPSSSHHVEACFQPGENPAATFKKALGVIVSGTERATNWVGEGDMVRRITVLRAYGIGPSLVHAVDQVMKTSRTDACQRRGVTSHGYRWWVSRVF